MTEPMMPSAMREELLAQHKDLRARVDETRAAIAAVRAGTGTHEQFFAALTRLAAALGVHNAREEALLKDVIPDVDAWGPARADLMFSAHVKEHELLFDSLVSSGRSHEDAAMTTVSGLLDELVEHMTREEKGFLGEEVLHDDVMPRDVFGG